MILNEKIFEDEIVQYLRTLIKTYAVENTEKRPLVQLDTIAKQSEFGAVFVGHYHNEFKGDGYNKNLQMYFRVFIIPRNSQHINEMYELRHLIGKFMMDFSHQGIKLEPVTDDSPPTNLGNERLAFIESNYKTDVIGYPLSDYYG